MEDKKTYRGVYLNTSDSIDYFFVYKNYKLFFSSEFNLRRFKDKICKYTYEESEKFINKYNINIDLIDYFIFSFYENIEKRGFKVEDLESGKTIVNGKKLNIAFTTSIIES